ncbi:hypothetical protein TA3x_002821 [Tundrisphaera sp. TA3]|uniref:hypothetical protein n=1 Tax=Tundrisphaera sp. TA3 TaxID=3435775 RepID=UPI003EBAAA2E
MTRGTLIKAFALAAMFGLSGLSSAKAQDWGDYMHWPYIPPQSASNGFNYKPLYDNWYVYPREQRIVPQIQSKYYMNYYGGQRVLGIHKQPFGVHGNTKKKFYQGHHYTLDVF